MRTRRQLRRRLSRTRRSYTWRTLYHLLLARSRSVPRRDFSRVRIRGFTLIRTFSQTPTSRPAQYQVGAPRARRPLAHDRTCRSRQRSAPRRHRARGAALRRRRRRRPCQGLTQTRPTGWVFGIASNILALSSQSPPAVLPTATGLGEELLDRAAVSQCRTGLLRVAIQDVTIHVSAHAPPPEPNRDRGDWRT